MLLLVSIHGNTVVFIDVLHMLLLGCGFAPVFVNYKKGALDPHVIKFTSCLPMVGGSLLIIHFSDVTL